MRPPPTGTGLEQRDQTGKPFRHPGAPNDNGGLLVGSLAGNGGILVSERVPRSGPDCSIIGVAFLVAEEFGA